MKVLTPQFKSSLDKIIREEITTLSRREMGSFLIEVSDYLQNLCPKHRNHTERYKCETCEENCKYGIK